MTRTKISEFDSNANNNTDVDGINLAEGMAPSGVNNAIRELMSQLKAFQAGTSGDSFNGPVNGALNGSIGATAPSTGAFTTLAASGAVTLASTLAVTGALSGSTATFSGNVTLNGGSANGVTYLNGSKVLTSGSALTYNGIGLGIGVASATQLLNLSGAGTSSIQLVSTDSGGKNLLLSVSGSLVNFNELNGNPIAFGIGNSEQMRLTSTGLGIGTSSPAYKLDVAGIVRAKTDNEVLRIDSVNSTSPVYQRLVNGGGNSYIGLNNSTGGGILAGTAYELCIATESARPILFGTNNTTRMTLDASGNLGLGVTPSAWTAYKAMQIDNGSIANYSPTQDMRISSNAYYNSGWKYIASAKASQYLQDGSLGGHAWFTAPSGTAGNAISFTQAMTLDASGNLLVGQTSSTDASFRLQLTGTGGSIHAAMGTNSNALRFSNVNTSGVEWAVGTSSPGVENAGNFFSFTQFSGSSWAERARIDSSGNLLVGTTSAGGKITASGVGGSNSGSIYVTGFTDGTGTGIWMTPSADNATPIRFTNAANTTVGSITTTSSVTLYNTTSDQRLKENITDADSASALIDSLQVRQYDWKSDGTHQRYGFVAQEFVTVAPEAVHQPEDPEAMMSVDYSKLVPMLVKEIQSLRQRLAALEAA